jgi:hypothetical protein
MINHRARTITQVCQRIVGHALKQGDFLKHTALEYLRERIPELSPVNLCVRLDASTGKDVCLATWVRCILQPQEGLLKRIPPEDDAIVHVITSDQPTNAQARRTGSLCFPPENATLTIPPLYAYEISPGVSGASDKLQKHLLMKKMKRMARYKLSIAAGRVLDMGVMRSSLSRQHPA